MLPVGLVMYGGMVAMQTLWAGPWLVTVVGLSAAEASAGLFGINVCMLLAFSLWGWAHPVLNRRGWKAEVQMVWGLPLSLMCLAVLVGLGPEAGWPWWALYCVISTVAAQAQPAVAMALPVQAAGRALSAYNLAIFAGVVAAQWGLGLVIDAFSVLGWSEPDRYRAAMGVFLLCCVWAYLGFLRPYARSRVCNTFCNKAKLAP
jgi:hypothetical protein